jgi:hypothetical protein
MDPSCDEPNPTDPLFEVQLRVARKADALVREEARGSGLNLQCWLLAEAEVFDAPSAASSPSGRST